MPLYEHVYLARQDLSAQQVDELTGQFKGVIEQLGGSVQKVEYWGVKSLTYRIRKNRKAHFTLSTSTPRPRPSPRSSGRSASMKMCCVR